MIVVGGAGRHFVCFHESGVVNRRSFAPLSFRTSATAFHEYKMAFFFILQSLGFCRTLMIICYVLMTCKRQSKLSLWCTFQEAERNGRTSSLLAFPFDAALWAEKKRMQCSNGNWVTASRRTHADEHLSFLTAILWCAIIFHLFSLISNIYLILVFCWRMATMMVPFTPMHLCIVNLFATVFQNKHH